MSKSRSIAACALIGAALTLFGCSSSKKSSSSSSSSGTTATTAQTTTTSAAPAQTVTITPATGLKDGQIVTVVGKGYTPGKQYGLTECADKGAATTANDCNLRGIKIATADSTGTVTSPYPIAEGPFGGPNSNQVNCANPPGCIVSVANAGSANPTEVATAKLSFGS